MNLLDVNVALPLLVGFGVIAIASYYILRKSKRLRTLITLQDPNEKYALPLIEKEEISHDTRRFRFGLPTSNHVLGLPTGQHVHLIATINGETVIRAYTPVTSDEHHGYVDLVVKVYFKNVHPRFPDGGKLSQYLNDMKIGDTIDFKGPSGRLKYLGNGTFEVKKLRKDPPVQIQAKEVNMIAGGSGITPMLQIIRHITSDSSDKTKLKLLYANQSEDDILLRQELEAVAKQFPDQFSVWYTIDRANQEWSYSVGFVNDLMIKDHLFAPSPDVLVLQCGPPPMIKFACTPALDALGYDAERRFAY